VDFRRLPPDALLILAAAAAAIALVQTLRIAVRAWLVRRRLRGARERGAAGEVRAEALLKRMGFAILGRQVAARYGLGVDGAEMPVDLRADFVVARGGRCYVAEVKTGTFAPRLETAATRRQLLEYRVAFAVDGVLLVDAEAGRVHRVEFPLPPSPRAPSRLAWLLAGAACGALAVVLSGKL
jgi:hypothetical protein